MNANGAAGRVSWGFWLAWVGVMAVVYAVSMVFYIIAVFNAYFIIRIDILHRIPHHILAGLMSSLVIGSLTGSSQRLFLKKVIRPPISRWLLLNIIAWAIGGIYFAITFYLWDLQTPYAYVFDYLSSAAFGSLTGVTIAIIQINGLDIREKEHRGWILSNAIAYSLAALLFTFSGIYSYKGHYLIPAYKIFSLYSIPIVIPAIQAFGLAAILRHPKPAGEAPA